MWTTTYLRFASRAAFLGVCEQAGWPQTPGQEPGLPQGVVLDVIGPLVTPASVGPGGVPMPSEMLEARYHFNLAWHAREMDRAFATSQVLPDAPSRGWDLAPFPAPGPPPVPASVPAWNGKAALREAGLLAGVETAVKVAGGRAAMLGTAPRPGTAAASSSAIWPRRWVSNLSGWTRCSGRRGRCESEGGAALLGGYRAIQARPGASESASRISSPPSLDVVRMSQKLSLAQQPTSVS